MRQLYLKRLLDYSMDEQLQTDPVLPHQLLTVSSAICRSQTTLTMLFCSACLSVNNHVENSSSASSLGLHGVRGGDPTEVDNGYKSYENTTVWLLSTINCLIIALVFSKGKPFRQPIYTNCKYGERRRDL